MEWTGPLPSHLITTDEQIGIASGVGDADWERFDAAVIGADLIARVRRRVKREGG